MASRHQDSESDDDDRHDVADAAYYAYGSPVQSRLEKQFSRKARRSKGESKRSSGHRRRSGHATGRLSPANISSGSEDRRSAEQRAADVESRTTQRKKERYDKFTFFGQHPDGLGGTEDDSSSKPDDMELPVGDLHASTSELSLSSEGSSTPASRPLSARFLSAAGKTGSTSTTPTIEPVPRQNLRQYASRIVRGLELVESARFYVKQALSIGTESSMEADQKAAALRLWVELQAALRERDVDQHHSVLELARGHVDKLMCEIEQFQWNLDQSSSGYAAESPGLNRMFERAFSSSFQDDNRKQMAVVEDLGCFSMKYCIALQSVNTLLSLFEQACTLYPSRSVLFQRERPEGHTDFDNHLDTLLAWSNASWQLATTLSVLQKWIRVDLSTIALESVEPDDVSDIVLGALSNPAVSSGTLEPVKESTVEEELSSPHLPISLSVPARELPPTEVPHDVTRSKSDNPAGKPAMPGEKEDCFFTHRYHHFVDAALKRLGLSALLKRLFGMTDRVIRRVHSMFQCAEEQAEFTVSMPRFGESSILSPPPSDTRSFVSRALSFASLSPSTATAGTLYSRQQSGLSSVSNASRPEFPPGSWEDEFASLGLPSLAEPFLAVLRVPIDIIQEVVRLWLEQQPGWNPSTISIRQVCHRVSLPHVCFNTSC